MHPAAATAVTKHHDGYDAAPGDFTDSRVHMFPGHGLLAKLSGPIGEAGQGSGPVLSVKSGLRFKSHCGRTR